MANPQKELDRRRLRKKLGIRRKTVGTTDRPRLSVFRSNKHIACQVIDDQQGRTLCAASTLEADLRGAVKGLKKAEAAVKVGEAIARKALEAGVARVRFHRGWYKYHGRVKALADGARKAGLEF